MKHITRIADNKILGYRLVGENPFEIDNHHFFFEKLVSDDTMNFETVEDAENYLQMLCSTLEWDAKDYRIVQD